MDWTKGYVAPTELSVVFDRRIERQRGVFTFHPHPALRPPKIAADVYVIEFDLVKKLIEMLKGLGLTDDYYFPDYAGIATAVKSDSSLC